MKMNELFDGIFSVLGTDFPDHVEFVRQGSKDGKIQPLLHICERDKDPTQKIKSIVLYTGMLWWDFYHGHYMCDSCKSTFNKPESLKKIWSDGHGTGQEAHA